MAHTSPSVGRAPAGNAAPDASGADPAELIVHATTVAANGRAIILTGASGSGKSALALQLIALGAELVADDRTRLRAVPDGLEASPPPQIAGLIEARHVGLLRLPHAERARLALAVDLDSDETERLPNRHTISWLGHALPLLRRVQCAHFASALMLCLAGSLIEP